MSPRLPPICLLDPLTLAGRELLNLIRDRDVRTTFAHTGQEDEHQIAELAGRAELVPPLADPDEIPSDAVLVVTAKPAPNRAEALDQLLRTRPTAPVLDLAPVPVIPDAVVLPGAPARRPDPPRVRVASPAATGIARLLVPLLPLGLEAVTATVERPASAGGMDRVERVAKQAAARLEGRPPEPLADGAVLAFNLVAEPDPVAGAEVAQVLPQVPVALGHVRSGAFHGWAIHLGLVFSEPVEADAVEQAWRETHGVEVVHDRLALDEVTERDEVMVRSLELARGNRHGVAVAFLDGLRVGGAATALEILETLL